MSPPTPQKPYLINGSSSNNTSGTFSIEWVDLWDSGYLLEQQVNGGAFSSVSYLSEDYDNDTRYYRNFSNLNDGAYRYRTRQCNPVGCVYSNTLDVNVARSPAIPASLSLSSSQSSGSFTISWSTASYATSYELRYQKNNEGWSNVYQGGSSTFTVSNLLAGNYQFTVRSCNTRGSFKNCSGWSSIVSGVVTAPSIPTLTLPIDDADGSFSVTWNSLPNTTSYRLQEQFNGVWGAEQVVSGATFSTFRSVNESGVYSYRVRACNSIGCGSFSAVKNISVAIVGMPISIGVSPNLTTGVVSLSLGPASGAPTRYEVQQQINNGSWSGNVYSGTSLGPVLPAAMQAGSYKYRVRACKVVGGYTNCSGWLVSTVSIVMSVPSVPMLTVPANSSSGLYTISWGSVASSGRYELRENGALIQNSSATSRNVGVGAPKTSGSYTYSIRACNSIGCGAESASKVIDVAVVSLPSISSAVPSSITGIATLSIAGGSGSPTRYEVQQNVNNGAWTSNVYSGAASTVSLPAVNQPGNYRYRVRACKVVGSFTSCSGWVTSNVVSFTAPASTPFLVVPNSSNNGEYTVSWAAVANASHYQLLEDEVEIQSSSSTSVSFVNSPKSAGSYSYQARACNAVGCTSYSEIKIIEVVDEPSIDEPPLPILPTVPVASQTIDQARSLPGEFEVNSGGQANYRIPVLAAPGSAGLTPTVSISYSSGAGNGIVGLGWSLNAGGSISRCRQTDGIDKNALPVTWSSKDRFCLNGQRLLIVSGSYGQPESTYKTEIDGFSRITAKGGAEGHPDYFLVEYKNGVTESYGHTADSTNAKYQLGASNSETVLNWSLSRRSDSAGNKIVYHYANDSFGQRLINIDYAFGNGSSRGAYIAFSYEDREDPISGYVAGFSYATAKRLEAISVFSDDQELRRYEVTYNQGSAFSVNDKLSRISGIQECVESTCSPATEFDWALISPGFDSAGSGSSFIGGVSDYRLGDIDGDGLIDLLWYEKLELKHNSLTEFKDRSYRYALGGIDSSGLYQFDTENGYVSPANFDNRHLYLVDKNNDGRMDILAGGNTNANYIHADIDGDGLVDTLTWLNNNRPWEPYYAEISHIDFLKKNPLADVTSENFYHSNRGWLKQEFDSTAHIPTQMEASKWFDQQYYLSVDQGGQQAFNNMHLAPIQSLYSLSGDFNGSGRMDIVASAYASLDGCTDDGNEEGCLNVYARPAIYTTHWANSTGLNLKYYSDNINVGVSLTHTFAVDLNGDGLTDIVTAGGTQWYFRINNGVGMGEAQPIAIPGSPFNATTNVATDVVIADYNDDGYPDFIWHSPNQPFNNSTSGSGEIKVRYWNPKLNNFDAEEHVIISMPYQILSNYSDPRYGWNSSISRFKTSAINMMDINGDGRLDLLTAPTTQNGSFGVRLGSGADVPANKIISIREGLGRSYSIDYGLITNSDYHAGGNILHAEDVPQHCTQLADELGNYNQSMCWDVAGATNTPDFYQNLNAPWHNLSAEQQSLKPEEPTFSKMSTMLVVTGVSRSSPTAGAAGAESKSTYFYEKGRNQASGRGFLGFGVFTEVNNETGLRYKTELRQDWPYIGRPLRKQVFTSAGNILSETNNYWGLAECYPSGVSSSSCIQNLAQLLKAQGSGALGAMQVFLPKSNTKTYALADAGATQGLLLSETEVVTALDEKGNTINETTTVTGSDGSGFTKSSVSEYLYAGSTWSIQQGRLRRLEVTSSNAAYGAITRVSEFDYYTSGSEVGLLKTETIEPDNANFTLTTTHTYSQGNRITSAITANGQTRQIEVSYDARARYVDYTYGFFTNGTNPDSPVRRTVSQVVNRDKYGTPTETRHYTSPTNYLTKKTATTPFGIPYFTADSTGAATEIKLGSGSDAYNICPSDTKVWALTQTAGGGSSIQCSDVLGRARRAGSIGFDGTTWNLVDTEYDKLGRTLRTSSPYSHNSSERYWTSTSYDILGRPVEVRSPYKNTYVTTYMSYTNLDTTITNPGSQTRTEKRDLQGQVIEVIDPNSGSTRFAYDARGNMREMKDPALNTTTVGYDLRDRKTSMSDPDKGNWIYKYNSLGDLVCQMDGKGQTSVQQYDIAGRVFSRTDRLAGGNCDNPSGAVEKYTQWTFDTAANGMGQLASVFDSTSVGGSAQYQQAFTYDQFGRPAGTTTTLPGHLGQVASHFEKVTYDQYGRLFQTFDAARTSATFTTNGVQNIYNAQGYLYQVVDAVSQNGNQQPYYTVNEMNARGNVTNASYGNGVVQQATYYPESGLTKSLRADRAFSSLPLQDITLDWDELGNLDWREEQGTAGETARRNIRESFTYDSLNRLRTWVSSGDLVANETANYNNIDNITDKTGVGDYLYGDQCGASANAGPHALCRAGTTNYFYDNNGNMLNDSAGRSMKYTTYDLPSEISKSNHKTEFSYGPNRARYKRVDTAPNDQVSTTLYLGSVEKVYYPDGVIQWKRNVAGVGLITQTVNSSGVKLAEAQRYLLKDHLGSLTLITDEIGAVEQSNYFDPWGSERKIVTAAGVNAWQADNNDFRIASKPITTRGYTGHEHLAEVGLIHMNGRIYDGKLGRFVQADPIIQDPLRVQSLNRYSYVWNNPLNATDPSGFTCAGNGEGGCDEQIQKEQEPPVEEILVEGEKQKRERPSAAGASVMFVSGGTSSNAFFMFSDGANAVKVDAEVVQNVLDESDASLDGQKLQNKIMKKAATTKNSMAVFSVSAAETSGASGDAGRTTEGAQGGLSVAQEKWTDRYESLKFKVSNDVQKNSDAPTQLSELDIITIAEFMSIKADGVNPLNLRKFSENFILKADTFLYGYASRDFYVENVGVFKGGEINYIGVGVFAGRYGFSESTLNTLVGAWNVNDVLAGKGIYNLYQAQTGGLWSRFGRDYYNLR